MVSTIQITTTATALKLILTFFFGKSEQPRHRVCPWGQDKDEWGGRVGVLITQGEVKGRGFNILVPHLILNEVLYCRNHLKGQDHKQLLKHLKTQGYCFNCSFYIMLIDQCMSYSPFPLLSQSIVSFFL